MTTEQKEEWRELDEGSIWESPLVAAAKKLNNLVAIVDRNEFQANFRTEELIPLGEVLEYEGLSAPSFFPRNNPVANGGSKGRFNDTGDPAEDVHCDEETIQRALEISGFK